MNIPALLLVLILSGMAAHGKPTTAAIPYLENPVRRLIIYYPENWKASDTRPALVIFRCNIPHQREHFRKLGMVVIKPQTSTVNSGALPKLSLAKISKLPQPRNQVADCKSAIRFLRAHAHELGINPNKIVTTGTSGGGDLALLSHLNRTFENESDDKSVSHKSDGLVLLSPAFDGLDIWFLKAEPFLKRVNQEAPSFAPHLTRFFKNTSDEYLQPLDHRADLIELAATLGKESNLPGKEISAFQSILEMLNKRDWQLLHPVADARQLSASRILTDEPLPPTLILFGERDYLLKHQTQFVKTAKSRGQKFDHILFKDGAGHSFMTQPAFLESSTRAMEDFLRKHTFLEN